jgi:predicted flavoprotein YhiN
MKTLVNHKNLESAISRVGQFIRSMSKEDNVIVEIKPHKSKRSLSQNRLLWKWNQEIADHLREHYGQENSAVDVHEVMVRKKCGVKVIQLGNEEPIITRKETKKLNTKEFTEYLQWLDGYCSEHLKLNLPHPEDLYYSAMGFV